MAPHKLFHMLVETGAKRGHWTESRRWGSIAAMRRTASMGIAVLLISACAAEADNADEYRRVERAVQKALCATSEQDRRETIMDLATAVESYRGKEPEETGALAVEDAVSMFDSGTCKGSAQAAPK